MNSSKVQIILTTTSLELFAVCLFSFGILGESVEGKIQIFQDYNDELHDKKLVFQAVGHNISDWEKHKQNSLHRVKRDAKNICYGELGCFSTEKPFDHFDRLPSPPVEIKTKFMLFTRRNPEVPQIYSYFNFTAMNNSYFDASISTKVIIHGFGSTCNRIWASKIKLALLSVVESNIICVDWANGAAIPNYKRAAANTRLVGRQVAMLMLWLNEQMGSNISNYHLIGFSLGAHIAGFAGKQLKNLSRISEQKYIGIGLDPAGPLFESYNSKARLDREDALFVDVIHTNGDKFSKGGFGSWKPIGHVDFYPNGGLVQKGCSISLKGIVKDIVLSTQDSLCSHQRAYELFTESISPKCAFLAFPCDNYDNFVSGGCFSSDASHGRRMGYYANADADADKHISNTNQGFFYLATREDEPFCGNQFRITVESTPFSASKKAYGSLEVVVFRQNLINETFLITQTEKDNMTAGSTIQRMVVVHPSVTELIEIQLKYSAYQSWTEKSISHWSMERIVITSALGNSMSFCSPGLLLASGIPLKLTLTRGVCVNRFSVEIQSHNVTSRPVQIHDSTNSTNASNGINVGNLKSILYRIKIGLFQSMLLYTYSFSY